MGHMVRTILELVAVMAGFLDRAPDCYPIRNYRKATCPEDGVSVDYPRLS
jgi:hypothetical protein